MTTSELVFLSQSQNLRGRHRSEAVQFEVSPGYRARPVWVFRKVQKVLETQKKDSFTLRNLKRWEGAR